MRVLNGQESPSHPSSSASKEYAWESGVRVAWRRGPSWSGCLGSPSLKTQQGKRMLSSQRPCCRLLWNIGGLPADKRTLWLHLQNLALSQVPAWSALGPQCCGLSSLLHLGQRDPGPTCLAHPSWRSSLCPCCPQPSAFYRKGLIRVLGLALITQAIGLMFGNLGMYLK